jgi:hypothetical protein
LKTGTLCPTPGGAFQEGSKPRIRETVERKKSKTLLVDLRLSMRKTTPFCAVQRSTDDLPVPAKITHLRVNKK